MRYPTNIVDLSNGDWGGIFEGHNVDPAVIRAWMEVEYDDGLRALVITEEWFTYRPRVKWCEGNYGNGCDREGDWHSHWFEVRPGTPGAAFTTAYFAPRPEPTP